jgi:hypothetical protein
MAELRRVFVRVFTQVDGITENTRGQYRALKRCDVDPLTVERLQCDKMLPHSRWRFPETAEWGGVWACHAPRLPMRQREKAGTARCPQRVSGSSTMSERSVQGSCLKWAASGGRIRWASARRDRALLLIEATALRYPLTPPARN